MSDVNVAYNAFCNQLATNLKLTCDLFTKAFTELLEELLTWED